MKSLPDLIVTRKDQGRIAALIEENRITELHVEKDHKYLVGDIYIGKIQNILKNINAAFVDFGGGINGYLALEKEESFFYTKKARKDKVTIGDELIVQVEKEAVKTKLPVLTGNFHLNGRFLVLFHGQSGISISRKIKNAAFEKEAKKLIAENCKSLDGCGLILRTNAENADQEEIIKECDHIMNLYETLLRIAPFRAAFSCLKKGEHAFLSLGRDYPMSSDLKIVTDIEEFALSVTETFPEIPVRFYQDEKLSLTALYRISTALSEALGKKVWLKSGGYLIIEVTEALTVIDVNTGKAIDKLSKEENLYRTNREAAKEIALQLRLRNLSGIVIVDFIDLEDEEHTKALLSLFRSELHKDRTKTALVDMTALNLCEVTRKRIRRPLYEAIRDLSEGEDT